MSSPTSFGVAGAFLLQMWTVNQDGYPMGTIATPDNVDTSASAQMSSAYVSESFAGMSPPTGSRRVSQWFGNEGHLGSLMMGVNDFGNGSFYMAMLEESFNALLTKTTVDTTTVDGWAMTADNMLLESPPRVGFMFSTKARTLNFGQQWVHVLYPDVQVEVVPGGVSSNDGQNPSELQYNFRPSPATRTPLGVQFSSLGMGQVQNKDTHFRIRAPYRIGITTWLQDDAATENSLRLLYLPLYNNTGGVGGSHNIFTNNGEIVSVTTVDTTNGDVTFTAGAQGDIRVIAYATDFVESPA